MTQWLAARAKAKNLDAPPPSAKAVDSERAMSAVPVCAPFTSRRTSIFQGWVLLPWLCLALLVPMVHAQTVDDGLMLSKKTLFTGTLYTHDSWDRYWEGSRKRANGNIGTLTTQSATWSGNYGITDRLNLIASVPYVWTNASQGVLHSIKGFQDFTLTGKYSFLETEFTKYGHLRAIAVASASIPLTNYTPDFFPLSIGTASRRFSGRATLNFQSKRSWFLNASTAYTWRANAELDRSSYYTNGHLYLTNKVAMPNVFDYVVSAGYLKHGLMIPFFFTQQRTQGGGDIRRQDMPFVSNKVNFSKVSAMVMYPLPKLRGLAFQFQYGYIVDGRNVGQSTTLNTGLLYTFHFQKQGSSL